MLVIPISSPQITRMLGGLGRCLLARIRLLGLAAGRQHDNREEYKDEPPHVELVRCLRTHGVPPSVLNELFFPQAADTADHRNDARGSPGPCRDQGVSRQLSLILRQSEQAAEPNRPTGQQRQTPTAAPSRPGTRSLRFGCAKALAQNPAQSRGFGGPTRAPGAESPRRRTSWRWNQSPANSSLQLDP